jgi:nucleolysin TIA-1/TIAR
LSDFINVFPDTSGKWLGSRQIRCNWATKGANINGENQSSDSKGVVELTGGTSGEITSLLY